MTFDGGYRVSKAITDTGPPLHLQQIGYIHLLEIFEIIVVSEQVKAELKEFSIWESLKQESTICLQEETISDNEIAKEQQQWTNHKLQKADISVLALVRRMQDVLSLTDDLALRRAIESLGRVVIGGVGVLIRGYKERKLNKEELRRCIDLLFNDSSLYLHRAFRVRVLQLIDEITRE